MNKLSQAVGSIRLFENNIFTRFWNTSLSKFGRFQKSRQYYQRILENFG